MLRALEVDSREVKDLGYQQGFASPTTAHRRRAALGQLVKAAFRALWWRAVDMLAVMGRQRPSDDDEGCGDVAMPAMYAPDMPPGYAARLGAFVFVLTQDGACIATLDRSTVAA